MGSHARGPVCAGQKTVIRREQPLRNRRMTRQTFQTITQRWKITDISSAGTGKLRLHQLRNSPTAIKNAIKVIRKAMFVCKQTFSDRVASSHLASFTDKRLRFSRANELSPRVPYAILNKTVIFFLLATSGPRFPKRASTPPSHRYIALSKIYRDITRTETSRFGENKFTASPSFVKSSLRIFRLFNDRENRPLCGTGVFLPSSCTAK